MAVHTYIGARYVPRFMGTYDATQIYEALDVVDNGSGTSYIARDTVPAGTPLTDTTHWFVYGASSGAIVALQNDMIQAQNDILGLQNDVLGLQGDITSLENLFPGISAGKNRAYIIISDSYGTRVNAQGKNFIQIFGEALGLDSSHLYSGFVSGAAFAHLTPASRFLSILQSISVTNPDSITDIVVVGGANDAAYAIADTSTEILNFKTYVDTTYKNAKITLMPCGLTLDNAGMTRNDNLMATWCQMESSGIGYIANSQYLLRNSQLLDPSDLVHPSAEGVNVIAKALVNWATGAGVTVDYSAQFKQGTITARDIDNPSITYTMMSPNGNFSIARKNGIATFMTSGGGTIPIQSATPFNFVNSGGIELLLPNTYFYFNNNKLATYSALVYDNNFTVHPATILFSNAIGALKMQLYIKGVPSSAGITRLDILPTLTFAD